MSSLSGNVSLTGGRIADPDRQTAKRVFETVMQMTRIDISVIEAARRG